MKAFFDCDVFFSVAEIAKPKIIQNAGFSFWEIGFCLFRASYAFICGSCSCFFVSQAGSIEMESRNAKPIIYLRFSNRKKMKKLN